MQKILKKSIFLVLVLLYCSCKPQEHHASNTTQEKYISTEYEKGYVKAGHKVSFWEYYDDEGDLSLKMNYDNGQILFLKPDTSEYVIKKEGEWIKQKLKVYPRYIGSTLTFYKDVGRSNFLMYPREASRNLTEGYVYVSFEIDSTGAPDNFKVEKGIGGGCNQAALRAIKEAATKSGNWIPAQIDGKTCSSKFLMPIVFVLHPTKSEDLTPSEPEELPLAKQLLTVVVTGYSRK